MAKARPLPTVTATEFARNFSRYREMAAERGVVNVTSHGRIIGGYLSASQLELFEVMRRQARRAIKVDEMDDETLALIESAEYGKGPA